jgi:hypothetical protein
MLTVVAMVGIGVIPMMAGSAAIGSVAGSRNATLSGQAVAPNTTVFSGDSLQVRDGVAVVAMDKGSRMVFGQETEASFLRTANKVTVLLGRGNVSLYHPGASLGLQVKAGGVTVAPASGYKTLGEVAMLNGAVQVTAKEGTLEVEGQGRTQQVAQGKTVTVPVNTARAPVPNPPAPPDSNAHITTSTAVGWLAVGAGGAAAVLAGIGISRSSDAKTQALAATTAANNATTAANNATTASDNAANVSNAVGCALNTENAQENPGTPSPYVPPSGFSCP